MKAIVLIQRASLSIKQNWPRHSSGG
jgi:hypothetical protein